MASSLRLSLFAVIALCLASCGVTENISDTFKNVFDGKRKTLATQRLSVFDYENALRGGIAGKMIGAAYGASVIAQPNVAPSDVVLPAWNPDWTTRALESETILPSITLFEAMQAKGISISPTEAALIFARTPHSYTGGNQAVQQNIRAGIMPPDSGRPKYNPFADSPHFQNNIDILAMLSPGMPQTAIRLIQPYGEAFAYADGVYGANFIAAMLATAMMNDDVAAVVESGRASLPPDSRYAQMVRAVVDFHRANPNDWAACARMVMERGGGNSESAAQIGGYVALSLLYGKGDFEMTLYLSSRCGRGDPRPSASACGVLGAVLGYGRLPEAFASGVTRYANAAFLFKGHSLNSLVSASVDQAQLVIERRGGTKQTLGQREYFSVPIETAYTPDRRVTFDRGGFEAEWATLDTRRADQFFARVQKELNQWQPDWTLLNCGGQIYAGRWDEYEGRDNVFVTAPVSREVPARMTRSVAVPGGSPKLTVIAGASNLAQNTGWILRVFVNDQVEFEKAVIGEKHQANWQEFKIDLSKYAGQTVTLALENGTSVWDLSTAYWARVDIK
ncbi:MAG: ADP-ribosylglycohydrolase family protein [Candidatus Hinthialibacter antarcticus]|nr:ADP-ribosylglycohydrolase family protein [Candidatus Hinthialibacter antarcticus]